MPPVQLKGNVKTCQNHGPQKFSEGKLACSDLGYWDRPTIDLSIIPIQQYDVVRIRNKWPYHKSMITYTKKTINVLCDTIVINVKHLLYIRHFPIWVCLKMWDLLLSSALSSVYLATKWRCRPICRFNTYTIHIVHWLVKYIYIYTREIVALLNMSEQCTNIGWYSSIVGYRCLALCPNVLGVGVHSNDRWWKSTLNRNIIQHPHIYIYYIYIYLCGYL